MALDTARRARSITAPMRLRGYVAFPTLTIEVASISFPYMIDNDLHIDDVTAGVLWCLEKYHHINMFIIRYTWMWFRYINPDQ